MSEWITDRVRKRGDQPQMVIVAITDKHNANECESFWIDVHRSQGHPLINSNRPAFNRNTA